MLTIDIIENKPYLTNPVTQERSLDILTPSWNTKNIKYSLKSIAVVSDDTEMRPDLISMLYLYEASSLGSILKLNNISNPLSLKSGEILFIPGEQMIKDLFDNAKNVNNQKQKAKTFRKELQEKISQVSKDRVEYLNTKNVSNLSQNPLPPNILQEGEQQVLVEEGRLIFGPNAGQRRGAQKKSSSISDIKSKIAQKNIFRR